MNKKELLYTICLASFLLFFASGIFTCYCFFSSKEEELSYETLDKEQDLVKELMEYVTKTTLLREASYNHENVEEETIIRYTYAMKKESDSTWIRVIPKKIVCEVTNKVSFISSSPCLVEIIPNSVFKTYEKRFFQTQKEFTYPDLIIRGNKCVNDGVNYYCLKGNYVETSKTFSLVKEAYRYLDSIVIFEYYVKIDTNTIDSCLLFYPISYCEEYTDLSIYHLEEEDIKEKGTLYKHTFREGEKGYFLESSMVV